MRVCTHSIENNYYQSGADLDEFKEVAPGVLMPPVKLPGAAAGGSPTSVQDSGAGATPPAPADAAAAADEDEEFGSGLKEVFGLQAFAREEVRATRSSAARSRGSSAPQPRPRPDPDLTPTLTPTPAPAPMTPQVRDALMGMLVRARGRLEHGGEEGPAISLPTLIKAAHDVALAQLTDAKARRQHDVAALDRAVGPASVDGTAAVLRGWAARMEAHEARVREAERNLASTEALRVHVSSANELQKRAAERRADARRQAEALALAEARSREALLMASEAEAAAAEARSKLPVTEVETLYVELQMALPDGFRKQNGANSSSVRRTAASRAPEREPLGGEGGEASLRGGGSGGPRHGTPQRARRVVARLLSFGRRQGTRAAASSGRRALTPSPPRSGAQRDVYNSSQAV